MSWFRLDDQGAFHEKVLAAGNEAYGAWCRAGQWSSGRRTEGFIPRATALSIAPLRIWQRLVAARGRSEHGLIEVHGDDFQMHDYLEWNPTADEVEAKRAARAEAGRRGGQRSAESRRAKSTDSKPPSSGEANAQAIASANAKQNPTPSPSPSPSQEDPPEHASRVLSPAPIEAKPKQRPRTAKKPEVRIPEDFGVSPAIEAICRGEKLPNPHDVLPDFRDWAEGKDIRRADWEATFRRWMRDPRTGERYPEWRPPRTPSPGSGSVLKTEPPLSADERAAALRMLEDQAPSLFRDVMFGDDR